jgi:membrane fusion protein (multidrug efflux system)
VRQAELASARSAIERLTAEQVALEGDRRGRLASLSRERVVLEGQLAASASSIARYEDEADRRRVRAPVSGRLGEVHPVQVGAFIRDGERLASIVPDGKVRVVAEFTPQALGRVWPGQHARLRLDGFPWMQYGYVGATVTRAASETREQLVRVELAVQIDPDSAIPLQHGMPGVVEVEVERVAPLALLARSLGYALSDRPSGAGEPSTNQAKAR